MLVVLAPSILSLLKKLTNCHNKTLKARQSRAFKVFLGLSHDAFDAIAMRAAK